MRVIGSGLIGSLIFLTGKFSIHWQVRLGMALGGMLLWEFLRRKLAGIIKQQSPPELLIKGFSLLLGLFTAGLLSVIFRPVMGLMLPLQNWALTLLIGFLSIIFSIAIGSIKLKEWCHLFFNSANAKTAQPNPGTSQLKILDTSSIIDGRIADLCKTHFLEGGLVIPGFVLAELQKIADSPDPLRRNRGRRGLDMLNKIQKENQITVKIFDRDYEEINEVDAKLLRLAMELGAKVITNDFNLNKVAELYGVQVLNINELSNAIKPVVLPGEEMVVYVLRDGKEYGQGIGYLEDGTMIVIEGGKSYIGMNIEILVTSVLQTSAGRMIFAKPSRDSREYALSKALS